MVPIPGGRRDLVEFSTSLPGSTRNDVQSLTLKEHKRHEEVSRCKRKQDRYTAKLSPQT